MGRKLLLIVTIPILASCHVLSRLADFQDIVRQRKNGNNIAQCPCVLHPESGRCIVYNSRYQASNLEEAMLAFHDLTTHNEPNADRDSISFSCRTTECLHCFGLLYYRLFDLGLIEKDFRPVTQVLQRNELRPSLCSRYRFLVDPKVPAVPFTPPYVQSVIESGLRNAGKLPQDWQNKFEQFGSQSTQRGSTGEFFHRCAVRPRPCRGWEWNPQTKQWEQTAYDPSQAQQQTFTPQQGDSEWNGKSQQYIDNRYNTHHDSRRQGQWQSRGFVPSPMGFGGYGRRKRRAAKQSLVGSRFIIGCSNRGESEDNMLALCGSCWAWRQLPDDYFPRLLNELSCKEDDFCLSGWGECLQQFRNVEVLRRVGGQWQTAALSVATCCDCRVRAGTEVHALVVGDRK
ncbi:hypothetical protein Q1695_000718 [Nippostrongylus brasiliensis]|nr:hypothetical protein Q1695_000718 [Nippostrongylus brasiliensis]